MIKEQFVRDSGYFLSAFLLFQIHPIVGTVILPWFGGIPAVWTTVMLFFQVLLTGSYAYAYGLAGTMFLPRSTKFSYC